MISPPSLPGYPVFAVFLLFYSLLPIRADSPSEPAGSEASGADEVVLEGADAIRAVIRLAFQAMGDEKYPLSQEMLEAAAGSPLFSELENQERVAALFALGQTYNELNEHQRAVRQYRRILADFPGLVRVRLELARSFFVLGEDELADYHFRLVLAGDLPEEVEANVRRYLREIRQRRRWSFDIGTSVLHNTNINVRPRSRHHEIHGLPFQLSEDSVARSGIGIGTQVFGEYRDSLNQGLLVRIGGMVDHTHYSNSEFNQTIAAGHLGPHFLFDGGALGPSTISFLGHGYRRWLGGQKLNQGLGPALEFTFEPTDRVLVNARLDHTFINYDEFTHLDGGYTSLTLRPGVALSSNSYGLATFGVAYDKPEQADLRSWQFRFGLGYIRDLPFGFTVGVHPEYRYLRYDEEDSFFVIRRRDHFINTRVDVLNRRIEWFGFTPVLAYRYQYRTSTIGVFDFDQHRIEFSVTRRF